jgi:hypothetical protein
VCRAQKPSALNGRQFEASQPDATAVTRWLPRRTKMRLRVGQRRLLLDSMEFASLSKLLSCERSDSESSAYVSFVGSDASP